MRSSSGILGSCANLVWRSEEELEINSSLTVSESGVARARSEGSIGEKMGIKGRGKKKFAALWCECGGASCCQPRCEEEGARC